MTAYVRATNDDGSGGNGRGSVAEGHLRLIPGLCWEDKVN